ncbi:MAG: ATP-binding protein [Deltaproteobacteria bacterium]|nr:ATP-binding protein [Deltaproteobacteria bacterium]
MMPTRSFNTTGTCYPDKHYMLPPLPRLPDVNDMIEGEFYFVLHSPRQSGKTTCLVELTEQINSEGRFYAINCSLASLRNTKDKSTAMSEFVNEIDDGLRYSSVDKLNNLAYSFGEESYMKAPGSKVKNMLNDICRSLDRELVVFFDEADCLHEDPLITFLTQIRNGYLYRFNSPKTVFPRSMALVGMRDVRDYLHRVRPDAQSAGLASPFNVKKKSLSLANFTKVEIESLYGQHTTDTGQIFEKDAVERAWHWTEGQPWLVNALADNVIVDQFKNDYSRIVTANEIDLAVHDLLLRNETHFDSLAERLREPRVRRVVELVIVGAESLPNGVSIDDAGYVVDLGLLQADTARERYWPANPIYGEVIARVLTRDIQNKIPEDFANKWMDGTGIDMNSLLKAFQEYWRMNSHALKNKIKFTNHLKTSINEALKHFNPKNDNGSSNGNFDKRINEISDGLADDITKDLTNLANEAFVHLVLFAFLQRVLNGGADIRRECAMQNKRCDIVVKYKGLSYPLEIKIKGNQTPKESYDQLYGYMDISGSPVGWLVVFDKDLEKSWDEKIFWKETDYRGKTIHEVAC